MESLDVQQSPPLTLVSSHFLAGGLILLSTVMLGIVFPGAFIQHFFNPKLLALTHLLVLGWITLIIMGTLYQLLPVILEVSLYSIRMAYASSVILISGTLGLAWCFWNFRLGLPIQISGGLILLATLIFSINIYVTAIKSTKESIEQEFILASLFWLVFTVAAGLMLAINLTSPFLPPSHIDLLKLHAHAGFIGWFVQLIIGVATRIMPMFMVAYNQKKSGLTYSLYLINIGLGIGIVAIYFQHDILRNISFVIGFGGLSIFLRFLFGLLKLRIKKSLDSGMQQSFLAFGILLLAVIQLMWLLLDSSPGRSLAYGITFVAGFVTMLIMGQTYKILPFIIWLDRYHHKTGSAQLPKLKDLYSEPLAFVQMWTYLAGVISLILCIILKIEPGIRLSLICMMAGVSLYIGNMIKMLFINPKKS